MTDVIMPKMGDGMEEGTLLEWLKKDGEAVKSGEVIATIQTDKATLEMEAPTSGVLTGFRIQLGDTVPVGTPIAAILAAGEKLPEGYGSSASAPAAVAPEIPAEVAKVAEIAVVASSARISASPLAKKMAEKLGIALESVKGTGPGGRITEKDVKAAGSTPAPTAAPVVAAIAPAAEDTEIPLNRLRQITAERTGQSKREVPHFYVTVEVDVEKLLTMKAQFEEEGGGKVSVNDFVVRACSLALREMPVVNSIFQGKSLIQKGAVNIGVAVALEEGLTLPVIHNADKMTVRQIGARTRELVAKAKDNRLHPDELSGSTFSISNMGMLEVDVFAAIINQPNSAILAIGSARKKVTVNENDEIEIRRRMNITGSFDHRVVDGAVGARFVNCVRGYLENPTRML